MAQAVRRERKEVWPVPAPTLVAYSTLMSRAVQVGKPELALRLWNLMGMQAEFFSSHSSFRGGAGIDQESRTTLSHPRPSTSVSVDSSIIVPDVKAANILMNVYAKLADVESAQILMSGMLYGNTTQVPRLTPNLVTYNSLLDACHKAGDLDAALEAKSMLRDARLRPDARTYTTLIATVGRRTSKASGAFDPTLAFSLLQEMKSLHVRPNGMTYCALIDVCGRCKRPDLALKGLRLMLKQKADDEQHLQQTASSPSLSSSSSTTRHQQHNQRQRHSDKEEKYALMNEVGAWTAVINALGKGGRLGSAVRLFYSMPNFGVEPNTVTCGCLMDCLLRNGRTADSLDLLAYMKKQGIKPTEVMYTSLMTRAESLVEIENQQQEQDYQKNKRKRKKKQKQLREDDSDTNKEEEDGESDDTKAVDLYTVLMKTLTIGSRKQSTDAHSKDKADALLLKAFLVLQEMKAVGAVPDLACYNVVLRACSRAGDIDRAFEILTSMQKDGIVPNDVTWREMLIAAGRAHASKSAERIWKMASSQTTSKTNEKVWKPSVASFSALVAAYLQAVS